MSFKVPVPCHGCSKTLNISEEHCGRRVICPKCKTEFRVPKLEDLADNQSTARLIKDQAIGKDALQGQSLSNNQFSIEYDLAPEAPRPKFQKIETKVRQANQHEFSGADKGIQSSGIFLVMVTILAAVLPMMGLQLRRLAKAGEYAPLAAIGVGIIGALMIAYARRNRGLYDAAMAAMSAVIVALIFGVGGFLYQRHQTQIALNQPDATKAVQANSEPSMTTGAAELSPSTAREGVVNRPLAPDPRPPESRKETTSRPPEFSPDISLDTEKRGAGINSSSAFSSSLNSGSVDKDDKDKNPAKIPSMVSNADLMNQYLKSEGSFQNAFSGQSSYSLNNLVGTESNTGNFYTDDCQSLGVFTKMRELVLVPILSTETADDKRQPNLIQPEASETLTGLRFAFSEGKIVGVQGLIKSSKAATMIPTQWVGTETSDVRESLNPDPTSAKIVCFSSKGKFIGFAWALQK